MARLIAKYAPSVLITVEKLCDKPDSEWCWRTVYVGEPGCLSIFESEHTHPGERFVYMCCYFYDDLTTACGEIEIDGEQLFITTKNSQYAFKIGKKLKPWQENESREKELSD